MRRLSVSATLIASVTIVVGLSAARAEATCPLTPLGTAKAAAVRDGRTLLLDDGREIRLAGLEAGEDAGALHALASHGLLRLARLGDDPDRYGRVVAFVYRADSPQSLQIGLLSEGQALFSGHAAGRACAEPLLAAERAARLARRGLWADPNFAPLAAEDLPGLAAKRGRFALIEGKILSVRESGATIYLNFGRNWTRGFSVTILKRRQRTFAADGVEPKRLEGRRVRVRGWVQQRTGPVVAAEAPEQIEILD